MLKLKAKDPWGAQGRDLREQGVCDLFKMFTEFFPETVMERTNTNINLWHIWTLWETLHFQAQHDMKYIKQTLEV